MQGSIQQARDGNPWPLIELQWGKVLTPAMLVAADDPRAVIEEAAWEQQGVLILDDFQVDMIDSMADPGVREVYVKGNTASGKNAALAIWTCVYYLIWDDAQIVITRDSYDTAIKIPFKETRKWWRRMHCIPPDTWVGQTEIKDRDRGTEHLIRVASPDSNEGFSGVHGEHVLFEFDEAGARVLAKKDSDGSNRYDLADTQATSAVMMANPRYTSGPFHRAFCDYAADPNKTQTVLGPYGYRRLITIDGADCLNVRLKCLRQGVAPSGGIEIDGEQYAHGTRIPRSVAKRTKPVIPGQICYDEYLGHCAKSPRWAAIMAHGRFPDEDPDLQVVSRDWLRGPTAGWNRWHAVWQRANAAQRKRLAAWWPIEAFGLDVGASDSGDPSVLTAGGKRGIRDQHVAQIGDAPGVVEWVLATARDAYGIDLTRGSAPIAVDKDGVGWGVVGQLEQKGCLVIPVEGNSTRQINTLEYRNLRTSCYGEFGKRLDPTGHLGYETLEAVSYDKSRIKRHLRENRNTLLLLPDDAELEEELRAHEKEYSDALKWAVTPKRPTAGKQNSKGETVQERIGRSPDRSDSAVYWWYAMQVRPEPRTIDRPLLIGSRRVLNPRQGDDLYELAKPQPDKPAWDPDDPPPWRR